MITEIDKKTALVLIDLQRGIAYSEKAHPVEDVLAKAAQLIDAFRGSALPVVIVNVNPAGAAWRNTRKDATMAGKGNTANFDLADFTKIADEIKTRPTDIFVTKQTWNAFFNTPLNEELQKRGITNIVLGGISTSIGVEGTARAASELGYNISFATDAMTDSNLESHEHSLKYIFPRLGESGTVEEIIGKMPK